MYSCDFPILKKATKDARFFFVRSHLGGIFSLFNSSDAYHGEVKAGSLPKKDSINAFFSSSSRFPWMPLRRQARLRR